MNSVVWLDRPRFWEPKRPESWLAYLAALSRGERPTLTARTFALRGLDPSGEVPYLLGVGLLDRAKGRQWSLAPAAAPFVDWRKDTSASMRRLMVHVLGHSPWLRLALLRAQRGEWSVTGRRGRAGVAWKVTVPATFTGDWFAGLEASCLGHVALPEGRTLALSPALATPSLTSLEEPLYLLDALRWINAEGALTAPAGFLYDARMLAPEAPAPHASLKTLCDTEHDNLFGFVPVEPTMRALAKAQGLASLIDDESAFHRWSDDLLDHAIARGALELLDAQEGQSRHGRGLRGDRRHKLVKLVVHADFDAHFSASLPRTTEGL